MLRLLTLPNGEAHLEHRLLRGNWGPRYNTLATALDATYPAGETDRLYPDSASPLDALLGVEGDDRSRLLALCELAGPDWITRLLRRKPMAVGTAPTGHELVELARKALARSRVADLVTVATELFSVERAPWGDGGTAAAAAVLAELIGDVTLAPFVDRGVVIDGHASERDDLIALAAVELLVRSRHGQWLRRCDHCSALFVPSAVDDEQRRQGPRAAARTYCRRAAPGHLRTCAEVGPQAKYAATLDGLDAAYRTEYKRLDKRARRGHFDRPELDEWRISARRLRDHAHEHGWTVERFSAALADLAPNERK